ncbi:MAG: sporulation protein, partial [Chloroflexota bacterium]
MPQLVVAPVIEPVIEAVTVPLPELVAIEPPSETIPYWVTQLEPLVTPTGEAEAEAEPEPETVIVAEPEPEPVAVAEPEPEP